VRRGEACLHQAQRLSHTRYLGFGRDQRSVFCIGRTRVTGSGGLIRCRAFQAEMICGTHSPRRSRKGVGRSPGGIWREKRDFLAEFRILLPDGTVKWLEANTHHEIFPTRRATLRSFAQTSDVNGTNRAQDEREKLRQLESKSRPHEPRGARWENWAASLLTNPCILSRPPATTPVQDALFGNESAESG